VEIKGHSSSPDAFESIWDINSSASPPVIIPPQINFMSQEDCGRFDTPDALLLLHFESTTMGSLVGAASLWGEVLQLAFQVRSIIPSRKSLSNIFSTTSSSTPS
jgi:hypothetical protein